MIGGRDPRSRRRFTVALVLAGGLLLIGSAVLLINPFAMRKTTAHTALSNQGCTPAGACSTATAAAHGSTGPSGSRNATPTPSLSRTPTATATPGRTPTPPPTPIRTPAPSPPTSTSPPPASGYFGLRTVGSWSWPAPGAMAAAFAARPRNQGGSYNPLWDSWLLHRVDGQFTGTTDEIFQWAACKWGLPDNLIRADAVEESTWFQYLHYPTDASYGGGGGGSCYWLYGCGDAFSSPTTDSIVYCNGIASQGLLSSEIHNYQKDPVTSAGGYPWTPTSGMCPKTFSILGIMSWDNPAWQAPYPAYAGNQNGTFPFTRDSTAAAADYWGAYIRGCYEGWESWLTSTKGDLWGCVGSWYSGDWHSSAANTYIAHVQNNENTTIWLTASFDDARQNYKCDLKYGCAS